MPLMGQHSENSGGSQGLAQALQQLKAKGDPASLATIRTIAQGGMTRGSSVPGWNETIDWGAADTGHGNAGGRAADRALAAALLAGDTQQFNAIGQRAIAQHKDWTGGTLADIVPAGLAAAGTLIGLPPSVTGAVTGGLESALGVTNRNVLSGAALGGAEGALVGAVPGIGHAATAAPGAAATGAGSVANVANAAVPTVTSAAASPTFLAGIGKFATDALKTPGVPGAIASTYGAYQVGKAEDAQNAIAANAALTADEEAQRRLNRVGFDEWQRRRNTAPGGA